MIQIQQTLAETQRSISQSVEQLTGVQTQLGENLACTNAAVERLDRLMDYLIKQDGERSNGNP